MCLTVAGLACPSQASQAALQRVEREWSRRLEEAREQGAAGRGSGALDRGSQTDTAISLEARLTSQRLRLQREAEEARERAVEEATKNAKQELQDKHQQELTQQVHGHLCSPALPVTLVTSHGLDFTSTSCNTSDLTRTGLHLYFL